MSESRDAWIALNLLTDLWPALRARLVEACDGPEGVLNGGRDRLRSVPGLRTDIINKIDMFDWKSSVCIELERARERGFSVLTPADPSYPAKLLEIHDPPPALYVHGELLPADDRAIAVVGSRRASFYGLECAREFGRDLAAQGLTVVSGLALGADAAAHQGALEAGGRTLAVLGSGLDVPYPRRNRKLLEQVAQHGAVLSEFPLGTPPLPHHFPQRNRVIVPAAAQFDPTAEVIVTVSRTRFDPAVVETRRGVRVTFHNLASDPGLLTLVADDGSFESWPLGPRSQWTHIFEQAGRHTFHVKEHPEVRGAAEVR